MKPAEHPLEKALEARVRLLETTLQPSSMKNYRYTVRLFLGYLNESFPEVRRASQLRRDPHLLGWLEFLWKRRTPSGGPLTSCTRGQHVLRCARCWICWRICRNRRGPVCCAAR